MFSVCARIQCRIWLYLRVLCLRLGSSLLASPLCTPRNAAGGEEGQDCKVDEDKNAIVIPSLIAFSAGSVMFLSLNYNW